ncbi:MAG: TraB/GumN family protein [Pseudomonadota bacterium]
MSGADAACRGDDLLARLAAEDPAAHQAIIEEGKTVLNGEARLWRVAAPSGAVSHLFGTYHDTGVFDRLSPAMHEAFASAERLVVELAPDEVAALERRVASDPTFSLRASPLPAGQGLAAQLSAAERPAAEAALAARGLTLQVADRLAPWLLVSALGVPACELTSMAAGGQVLDTRLMQMAADRGVPVLGLESYVAALDAIAAIPDAAITDLLVDALRLARHEEDIRATLTALYAEGRIGTLSAAIDAFGRRLSGRTGAEAERLAEAFDSAVLERRNREWMPALLNALDSGGTFVAVGALHLPGEIGLVRLLRQQGYTVAPISEVDP